MGEEDDWNCVFFMFPLFEVANTFFGGYLFNLNYSPQNLFESRLDICVLLLVSIEYSSANTVTKFEIRYVNERFFYLGLGCTLPERKNQRMASHESHRMSSTFSSKLNHWSSVNKKFCHKSTAHIHPATERENKIWWRSAVLMHTLSTEVGIVSLVCQVDFSL